MTVIGKLDEQVDDILIRPLINHHQSAIGPRPKLPDPVADNPTADSLPARSSLIGSTESDERGGTDESDARPTLPVWLL